MNDYIVFFQNHLALWLLLIVLIVAVVVMEFHSSRKGTPRMSAADAVEAINRRDAVIIDIRPFDVFKNTHIQNAINVPVALLEQHLKKIEKYKSVPVILYGGDEHLKKMAENLKQAGFLEVHLLIGGLAGWQQDNLPISRGA